MTSTTITVYRGEDDEPIEVEIEGDFEFFGSANPRERGRHLADWRVISPSADFVLTKEECIRAEEALCENQ